MPYINFTMSHGFHGCLDNNGSGSIFFPESDFDKAAESFPRHWQGTTVGHFTGLGDYSYRAIGCTSKYNHYAGDYDKGGSTYGVHWSGKYT